MARTHHIPAPLYSAKTMTATVTKVNQIMSHAWRSLSVRYQYFLQDPPSNVCESANHIGCCGTFSYLYALFLSEFLKLSIIFAVSIFYLNSMQKFNVLCKMQVIEELIKIFWFNSKKCTQVDNGIDFQISYILPDRCEVTEH